MEEEEDDEEEESTWSSDGAFDDEEDASSVVDATLFSTQVLHSRCSLFFSCAVLNEVLGSRSKQSLHSNSSSSTRTLGFLACARLARPADLDMFGVMECFVVSW